jgi:hypothetical protein
MIVAPRRCSEGGHGWDRPGPAPQPAEHEWFARLLGQGVQSSNRGNTCAQSPAAAGGCTIAGGQSRKRKIWSRYQSKDKRVRIADLHREAAARATAAELGVAGQYRPCTAQRLAAGRRAGSGRTSWSVKLYRPELGGLCHGCPGAAGDRTPPGSVLCEHDDDASGPPRPPRSTG